MIHDGIGVEVSGVLDDLLGLVAQLSLDRSVARANGRTLTAALAGAVEAQCPDPALHASMLGIEELEALRDIAVAASDWVEETADLGLAAGAQVIQLAAPLRDAVERYRNLRRASG